MKTIEVNASNHYEVRIGREMLSDVGRALAELSKPCKICVLTDATVDGLYGQACLNSLRDAGFDAVNYVIPHGEASKNGQNYLAFLNFLAENQFSRSDMLAALGGGVVGDLCGFTAATYLRGVKYVQIPTTMLAMVDSSVGGKTAIDLDAGKNLCGAFYPPSMVLAGYDSLLTLPENVLCDGMAEVIKYGVIRDADLFAHLAQRGLAFDREYVISRSVEIKRDIVEEDEFDLGIRQLLNFGHTVGHGIEKLSQYAIPHGSAVAAGMAIITRASAKRGICTADCADRLDAMLKAFHLPTAVEYDAHSLAEAMLSDKKRRANTITLILPKSIGEAVLYDMHTADFEAFIAEGM